MDPLPINPAQTAFKALLENPGISWKAKRYQVLLEQFSINFQQYLLTTPSLVDSIKKIHSNPEFKTTLIPLINHLLVSRLRHPTDPSNVEYLNFHRKAYYQCLTLLREAVRWAEINRDRTDITDHVFAACRIFYTETRFNFCALIIFGTFKEMGTQALSEKKSSHPPQYEATSGIHLMTKGLEVHHKRIKSVVGTEQTETWLSKIWNSTIGYVNGTSFTPFDPGMQSNFAQVVCLLKFCNIKDEPQVKFTVKNLAFGSPTIQEGSDQTGINPEMRGLLASERGSEQPTLLYINYQKFTKKNGITGSNERPRSLAIHELGEEFPNFYVMTLAHDGFFYAQQGHTFSSRNAAAVKTLIASDLCTPNPVFRRYLPPNPRPELINWINVTLNTLHAQTYASCLEFTEESLLTFVQDFHTLLRKNLEFMNLKLGYSIYQPGSLFREYLIDEIFDGDPKKTGFCIPEKLAGKASLREFGKVAAKSIHTIMFNEKEDLTPRERRIFLAFFYNYLTNQSLIVLKPKAIAGVCKDRIDRGAVRNAALIAEIIILLGKENDPKVVEFFEMIIFVRSIIVRKRTIIEKRLLELIEFVEFMLNHKEEVKELFKKVFPDYLIEYDPLLDVPQQANLNTLFQNDDLRLALAEVVLPELLKQENFLMLLIEIANKSDDENPPHLIAKEMPAELKEKIKGPSFLKEMKSESGITSLTKALLKKPSLVQQLFAELLKRQEDAIQAALNMKDNGDEL